MALAASLVASACSGGAATVETKPVLQSIDVTPASGSVAKGLTWQLAATGQYSDGSNGDVTTAVTWASDSAAVTVDATGLATAVAVGTANLTATSGAISGSASLTVTAAVVTSIASVSPPGASIAKGLTQAYAATGTYSDATSPVALSGVTWESTNPAVATIDANGVATAAGTGSTSIRATKDGVSLSTTLTVTPAVVVSITSITPAAASVAKGLTQPLAATGVYSDDPTPVPLVGVTWESSDVTVATVDLDGVATALATGSTTITATKDGGTLSTTLTVTPAVVLSIDSISPDAGTLAKGLTQAYSATGTWSDDPTPVLLTGVTWTSSSPTVATIDAAGLATAVATGQTDITAAKDAGTLSTTLTVGPAVVVSIDSITPDAGSIAKGLSLPFAATGTYSDATAPVPLGGVTWESSDVTVATIDAAGLARGLKVGSTTIKATKDGASLSTSLTVGPAVVVSIDTITPADGSVAKGLTKSYVATGTYSDATAPVTLSGVTWGSSAGVVATIDAAGLASSHAMGSTTITATKDGVSRSTGLTVTAPVVVSISSITASPSSVAKGESVTFTAAGAWSDDATVVPLPGVAWTSSDPTVATIDAAGVAATLKASSTTITATKDGATRSVTLTVGPAVLESISVAAPNGSVLKGQTQQFAATGRLTDGTTQDLTASVTWSSDAPNVAISNAPGTEGLAVALDVGLATITATGSGGLSGTAKLDVTADALTAITVSPATATRPKGLTQQFTATATYAGGGTKDVTAQVDWRATAPFATISPAGLATGTALGTSTVKASVAGISGTAALAVTAPLLESISVSPGSGALVVGETLQLTAMGHFSDGTSAQVLATWGSGGAAVTVSDTGLATAVAVGTATITATSGGLTGTASVDVTAAALNAIVVAPGSASIAKGRTEQLTATAHYADSSTKDVTSLVSWSSGDPAVSVSAAGLAKGEGVGYARLSAALGDVSGNAFVTVTAAELESIAVTSASPTVAKGRPVQLTATGTFSDGSTAPLATVDWTSSAGLSIDPAGLAQTLAEGSQTATATVGTISGSGTVTVTARELVSIDVTAGAASFAEGRTLQLTATGTYTDGTTDDVTASVAWSSDAAAVTVSNATGTEGLATADSVGGANVTATAGSIVGAIALTVTAAELDSVAVTADAPSVPQGLTVQLHANGTYSNGDVVDLTTAATWTSAPAGAVTVDANGLARGEVAGLATLTATVGLVSGSGDLAVDAPALLSISLSPASLSLTASQTAQLTAMGHYSYGAPAPVTASWTKAGGAATVSGAGLVTADPSVTGTVIVTATATCYSGGCAADATVDVTAAALTGITVSPASGATVVAGRTLAFSATATYAGGGSKDVTSLVAWSSSNLAVAMIDPGGVATGVGVGNATVTATFTVSGPTTVSGSAGLDVTSPELVSVEVTPASASVAKGLTTTLSAIGHYSDGSTQDLSSTAIWTVTAGTGDATVSGGLVTGTAQGTATVTAADGGFSGFAAVTVTAPVLQSIAVTPADPSVAKGQTVQLTATGTYSDASTQDLTGAATWASDAAVATVAPDGLAAGVAEGTTSVTAALGGVTSPAQTLTVTAPVLVTVKVYPFNPSVSKGLTLQFTATGIYSDSPAEVLLSGVGWGSSNEAAATIDSASGLATAIDSAAGPTTITATKDGVSGTTTLTVTTPALVSIDVTPADPSVAKGLTVQLTATGHYSDLTTADLTGSVAWASSDTTRATVTAGGLATGIGLGTADLTATAGTVSGRTTLTVTSPVLQSVSVSPATVSVALGYTAQFKATALYSDGGKVDVTTSAAWGALPTGIVSVSSTGLASTLAEGTATVSATVSGVVGSGKITVTPATLSSITLTPADPTIPLGLTQAFAATGVFSDGTKLDLTTQVTWSSSDTSVATVSPAGVATPVAPRAAAATTSITATHLGVTGQTTLTVTPETLTEIVVSPASATLADGTSAQFSATGVYTDLSTQDLTSLVTWSVNGSALTVSNEAGSQGVATGVAAGSAQVIATITVDGTTYSDFADVTVTAAFLTSISIGPAAATVPIGVTQQYTATGHFSDGSTQDLTTSVAWATSDPLVAAISNVPGEEGLATGLSTGTVAVSATYAAITGTATLIVSGALLESIAVTPATASLPAKYKLQFLAMAHYSDGSDVDVTTSVTWSSTVATVATISNTAGSQGLATGVAAGSTTIKATFGGKEGSAALTVNSLTLKSITVTAEFSPPELGIGETMQMTATGLFSDNVTTLDITTQCTWSSGSKKVASISKTGLVKGLKAGTSKITAAKGGKRGSLTVTVL